MQVQKIVISRTDSIGDVLLTLPMAGVLKALYPNSTIYFLGKNYTRDVVTASAFVDVFISWDELCELPEKRALEHLQALQIDTFIHVFPRKSIARMARKAKIPTRIGTTNRLYHWGNCNKMVRLSRKKSPLHEAQLNMQLIQCLGAGDYALEDLPDFYGIKRLPPLDIEYARLLSPTAFNLILHPKSKGSAREWGLDRFAQLIEILPPERFKIFITGTAQEGDLVRDTLIKPFPQVVDLSGKMSLGQLFSFISHANGLLAASTGPLHMAAACGIHALGIYPPIRPMHPGRWAPLGRKTHVFVKPTDCDLCRKSGPCECMRSIRPEEVKEYLISIL